MTVRRVLYLGTVVSNGGDAAIQKAQVDVLDAAFDGPLVSLHDNLPVVARRVFPGHDVFPQTFGLVSRPAGMALHQRVLRRLSKERVQRAARLWRGADGGPARLLVTPAEAAQLRSFAEADVVAYTGGTSLIEKYSVRGKLYEIDLALAMGKPVVLLPQSLGPFHDPANQAAVRQTLGAVDAVLLRDERSLGFLRDIGARTDHVHVVPDIVFALQTSQATARLATADLPASGLRVAVSVRDCAVFFEGSKEERAARDDAFRDAVAGLVTALVRDHGAEVTFVSTCQGVPEYWTDDSAVAVDVVGRLPQDVAAHVGVDRGFHTTAELLDVLAGFDLVVATRLHAAILSLDAGTPVLPVAYEFKTEEVMAQLGLGAYVVTIEDATTATLTDALRRLVADLPGLRPDVASRLAELGDGARAVGDLVRDAVATRGPRPL